VAAVGLAVAPAALAHAQVSPAVAKSGASQEYTLLVPNEKSGGAGGQGAGGGGAVPSHNGYLTRLDAQAPCHRWKAEGLEEEAKV